MRQALDQRHAGDRTQDEDALRQRVGDHRAVGDERHAPALARRLADPQVEDVVVANAVFHEEALVVARGAERAVGELDGRERRVLASRISNPQPPRMPIALAADVHVAAGLNHEVPQPAIAEHLHRAIDRIPFADAAQMDAHALARQEDRARAIVDLDGAVVHQRQPLGDGRLAWDAVVLIVVELPDVGEARRR